MGDDIFFHQFRTLNGLKCLKYAICIIEGEHCQILKYFTVEIDFLTMGYWAR